MSIATAIGGGVAAGVIAIIAAAVYRDASRVGVDLGSPSLWAAFIVITSGVALVTAILVPDAPIPGVLVLAALGPLLYVLERDDSMHGDDPADPTLLPSESGRSDAASESGRSDAASDAGGPTEPDVPADPDQRDQRDDPDT